ncbi:glycosyltransferase family 2 protein [Agromyces sp. NPDC058126]|uniref:glycosyltransferase family 2 protein n=1 Tax=Agromyces sp. NPDC058126 TaxID=3346350 RepID=UPI0036DD2B61
MPAYNEAEGIVGFLQELEANLSPLAAELEFIVVDDRSTDDTGSVLAALARDLPRLQVITAEANRGHGPTALAAYRAGLAAESELVVHVDGDGQFAGADVAKLVRASMGTDADVVHGVRTGRSDPWFRRGLTAMVGVVVTIVAGRRIPDVNTPLRAYRPAPLAALVSTVPQNALVPHVHFSIAEVRNSFRVRYVRVASLPRRGADAQGTMWSDAGRRSRLPQVPPPRLRRFARQAAVELWQVSLRPGRVE